MTEIFKNIPNYEGLYQVSNFGRIKSLERKNSVGNIIKQKILKLSIDGRGYYGATLYKNKKRKFHKIHQLVAIVFLNHRPDGTQKIIVDHKDNDKSNNHKNNLQLITHRQNCNKDRKGTSKYDGVSWNNNKNKWVAQIQINNTNKYLGSFENEIDAHNAYQKKLNDF